MGDDSTEDEEKKIGKANTQLLAWRMLESSYEACKCEYAAKVIDSKEAVECNYEDSAPGEDQKGALMATPFYSKVFNGVGLTGLLTYPIGYYTDMNTSRNAYYGNFSLQGSEEESPIEKKSGEGNRKA
jgi:hypothetical protein